MQTLVVVLALAAAGDLPPCPVPCPQQGEQGYGECECVSAVDCDDEPDNQNSPWYQRFWFRMLSALKRGLRWAICYFLNLVMGWAETIMNWVFDELPMAGAWVEAAKQYLKVANTWFPIEEGFEAFIAFSSFLIMYVVVKIIRRFIPTLG